MSETLYLTTTIPYVNARPHLGFALELVQADVIARYNRLLGREVQFQTGTDENAFSNVLSARALGIPVEDLVQTNSSRFFALCDELAISRDLFVRTADPGHHTAVQHFLSRLQPEDVYETSYRSSYCPRCEDFLLDRFVEDGCCPVHQAPVEDVEETNHFFRLSRYQDQVRGLIVSGELRITPKSREKEVLQFIDSGLTDFSISRTAARSDGWGVPFPGDPDQVVYVWVDALINYLSGLGYPGEGSESGLTAEGFDPALYEKIWRRDVRKVHLIGKNVWKFHAVYWPALLLSAGLPLPDEVLVHGFLTQEGQKISKSRGNAADPTDWIHRVGTDGVRHFLLAHVHPFEDSDFTAERIENAYLSDLANTLGNLLSRLAALGEQAGLEGVVGSAAPVAPDGFHEHLADYRFDLAAGCLWRELAGINRDLSEGQPWEDLKAGRTESARECLGGLVRRLLDVTFWLQPFLPGASDSVVRVLAEGQIKRCPPLFPRL